MNNTRYILWRWNGMLEPEREFAHFSKKQSYSAGGSLSGCAAFLSTAGATTIADRLNALIPDAKRHWQVSDREVISYSAPPE